MTTTYTHRYSAAAIIHALGGHGSKCRCPAHKDDTPSLSVTDGRNGKVLVHCHGGCSQERVIEALRFRGLWPDPGNKHYAEGRTHHTDKDADPEEAEKYRRPYELLRAIAWAKSTGKPYPRPDRYFQDRELDPQLIPETAVVVPAHLVSFPVTSVKNSPAMVLPVVTTDRTLAAHVTFLSRDHSRNLREKDKSVRRSLGHVSGGYIRLTRLSRKNVLVVAESIENALAALWLIRLTGMTAVGAISAISAGMMKNVDPHPSTELIIAGDNDKAGRSGAEAAATIWTRKGRVVRLAFPPKRFNDWNDVVRACSDHEGKQLGEDILNSKVFTVDASEDDTGLDDEWDVGEDTELPPPREWLLGNQFCKGFLSGLIAPGGIGKTALRMLQCLALATGRSLTAQHVFKRCRVLMVSLEDDRQEMRRRLRAACIHHGINYDELKGWLFCWTPKGLKLAEMKDGCPRIGELAKRLREKIQRLNIDFLNLDPFVKLHALEENSSGQMDFVCDLLATLGIEYNIGVDAPHHTRKGRLEPGDSDGGRGSSASRDAGRLLYTLNQMSNEEAQRFGIKNPRLYLRLDSAKVNLAPPAEEAEWFRLVSVPLDNGTDDYPNGDHIQTVEPWTPPDVCAGFDRADQDRVLDDIAAGLPPNGKHHYSNSPHATTRAVWPVVKRHCPDKTEPQCREIIRQWINNGVLVEKKYNDPLNGRPVFGLFVVSESPGRD
jgi:hypothetical protein